MTELVQLAVKIWLQNADISGDMSNSGLLQPGAVIGETYEILREIASGGMSSVYLAQHVKHPEFKVALKVLSPELSSRQSVRESFRNEARAGCSVSHPNIIKVFEFFDGPQSMILALEYVEGGSLAQKIEKEPLNEKQCALMTLQIASALAHLETKGIVHRDLKPENILLTAHGDVKLTDFGIASIVGAVEIENENGIAGTPRYSAPEYLEHGISDHRSDIYSLGVLSFELLMAEVPFPSDLSAESLNQRMELNAADVELQISEKAPLLAPIIAQCLWADPARRHQHAREIVDDILDIATKCGIRRKRLENGHSKASLLKGLNSG